MAAEKWPGASRGVCVIFGCFGDSMNAWNSMLYASGAKNLELLGKVQGRLLACLPVPGLVTLNPSHRPAGSCSFLGLPFRILNIELVKPKKGTTMETTGKP